MQEISLELGVPTRLVQQVLQTLLAARLVVQVSGVQHAYAPARPLDAINCHHILLAMRATVGQELLTRDEPVRAEVYGEFARIQAAEKDAAIGVSLLALVNRTQARLLSPPDDGSQARDGKEQDATPLQSEPAVAPEPTPVFPAEEIPTGLEQDATGMVKAAADSDTPSTAPTTATPDAAPAARDNKGQKGSPS